MQILTREEGETMDSNSSYAKDDKLRRIMDAALTTFSRSGYQGATMQEVASEAGVGKGTIYLYFCSKEELLETVLLDVLKRYRDQIVQIISSEDASRTRMRRLVSEVVRGADRRRRQFRFLLQGSWGMGGEFKQRALSIKKDIMNSLAEFVSEGAEMGEFRDVDARLMAHIISGTLDSLAAAQLWNDEQTLEGQDDSWADDLAGAVVDCLCSGVEPEQ